MIIYLLDDEELSLRTLEKAVKDDCASCEVRAFSKPSEFRVAFKEKPCDIAFLDINLPGISGLDIAKEIKDIKKDTNIIFVTGYSKYMKEAFDLFASGYLLKPFNKNEIGKQIENLRYQINDKPVEIITFGNFQIKYKGKPVAFKSKKGKELLAYLVDRKGVAINRRWIAAALFEESDFSRKEQKRLTKTVEMLKSDLKNAGIDNLLIIENGEYRINTSICKCDYYDYLKTKDDKLLNGEYMEEYEWADTTKYSL